MLLVGKFIFWECKMERTHSYTYFAICSNGEIGSAGLQSTDAGIFDPDDITKLLRIEPFKKWKKGDRRKQVQDETSSTANYGFSIWCAEKSEIDRLDVEKQCLETIKTLKQKIPELMQIKSLYDVNFYICVVPHIFNEEQPFMSFGKEVIEFCYLTGTEIDVDMYVYEREELIFGRKE